MQFFDIPGRQNEWLQIDLRTPKFVAGVITQGYPVWDEWIRSFKIKYGNTINILRFVTDQTRNPLVSKYYLITTKPKCWCTIF